jgi:hypothetical protein
MFQEKTKAIYIIHNSETKLCAEFMSGLIAELADKGLPINAVVIDAKKFASYLEENKHTKNKILYIGDSSEGKIAAKNVLNWQFDRFGIRYGWHGNKGVIKFESLSEPDFMDMAAYAENEIKEYQLNIRENVGKRGSNPIKQIKKIPGKIKKLPVFDKVMLGASTLFVPAVALTYLTVDSMVSMANDKDRFDPKQIKEQQQRFAVLHFSINHLADFMGIKIKEDNDDEV